MISWGNLEGREKEEMPILPYMEEERGEKWQLQTPGFDVGDPLCG